MRKPYVKPEMRTVTFATAQEFEFWRARLLSGEAIDVQAFFAGMIEVEESSPKGAKLN